jgi:hypothetical protein
MPVPFHRRIALAAVAAVVGLLFAQTARAEIWQPVATGVTADIDALEYQGANRLWIATSDGTLYRQVGSRFVAQLRRPGTRFTEISFQPGGGPIGLATGNVDKVGHLYRFNGSSWSEVSLAGTTWSHLCPGTGGPYPAGTPQARLWSVTWVSSTVAYVNVNLTGVILRSVDGGVSWRDASRQPDGTCRVPAPTTDLAAFPGDPNRLVLVSLTGDLYSTSDALATPAVRRGGVSCNAAAVRRLVYLSSGLLFQTSACGAADALLRSSNGGGAFAPLPLVNAPGMGTPGTMVDLDASGGTLLAAGGSLLVSLDRARAIHRFASGVTSPRQSELTSPTSGAVAGADGSLAITNRLNLAGDVTAPQVSIGGPSRVAALGVVTFAAAVADEPGGSGIEPGSITWRVGSTVVGHDSTFTSSFRTVGGLYLVRLTAADRAGNVTTREQRVTVFEDTRRPTGTISGPSRPGVGQRVTYTLTADDGRGAGVNYGRTVWTIGSKRVGSGRTLNHRFTHRAFYTLKAAFKDRAGNAGTTTKRVHAVPVAKPRPRPKVLPGRRKVEWVFKARDFGVPPGMSERRACHGKLRGAMKKRMRKRALVSRPFRFAVVRGDCRFSGRLKVSRRRLGRARRVTFVLKHAGNDLLGASRITHSFRVPKRTNRVVRRG